jgi:membrane associated rhomboid family serine protease
MIRFGGDLPYRITDDSEIWRMFTAPLLHASPFHIGFNLLVLFWAGGVFERIAGWKCMVGLFAIAALAGEALSITFLDPEIVGVGASGGNAGLIAGVLVMAARLSLQQSIRLRMGAVALLIPALLPAFASGGTVNVFAHGGGAVAGAAISLVLLKTWPPETQKPPARNLMLAAAVIFFGVAVYAVIPIARLLTGA